MKKIKALVLCSMLTLACGVMTTTVVFMPQTPVVVYAEGEEELQEASSKAELQGHSL